MFDVVQGRAVPRTAANDLPVRGGAPGDDLQPAELPVDSANARPVLDANGASHAYAAAAPHDLPEDRSTTQRSNCDSHHSETVGGAIHVATPAPPVPTHRPHDAEATPFPPSDLPAAGLGKPSRGAAITGADRPLTGRSPRVRWWREGETWIRLATVVAVLAVAGIAAAVSYRHMRGVALDHGEDHIAAAIIPISVDGLIVAASMTLLADSRAGRRRTWLPYGLLVLGSAASLAANVMHAEPDLAARVIAAWPPLALIGGYELLMSQIRATTRPTGNRPGHRGPGRRRHRAVAEQAHHDDARRNRDRSPASTGERPDASDRAHHVNPASARSARSAWSDGDWTARTEPAGSWYRHPAALDDVDDGQAFGADVEHRWAAAAGLPTQRTETHPGPAATDNPAAPSTNPPDELHAVRALNGTAATLTGVTSAATTRPVGLPSEAVSAGSLPPPLGLGEARMTAGTASVDPAPLTSKKAQLAGLLAALAPDDPRTPYALARDLAPALDLHEGTARRYIADLRKTTDSSASAA
ncbi:DUF2637 domain-containing protein [Pseudofrankia sp. BMG5.36]|uniref:DUF2637 domain-containing protein n=1 Tax=Pseudofrankia sp. BMG5.36 TaxID=1834512 RepID=UPI000B27400D|nr:DUF2637 domain-containing protein [Pseudofrankia sp. BMG5.36]